MTDENTDDDTTGAEDKSGSEAGVPPVADEEGAGEIDEAFDERSTEEVESDEVWNEVLEEGDGSDEQIVSDTDDEPPAEPDDDAMAPQGDVDGESGGADGRVAAVSKHEYCERCRFFSGPPEINCTHDGTEIVDFGDMETVRVSNCPIVAERQGLEQGGTGNTDLGEIQREE